MQASGYVSDNYYPACACAAKVYVIGCGVYIYIVCTFLEPIFFKYSLSEVYFNTDIGVIPCQINTKN